jgi:transcriptional regulator with XRE-family HTH domain
MCADQTTDTPSRHFRNLGKALVILRELRHMSQRRLARSTHGSTSQLSKYETGKALPKLETIERFLDALDITSLDLFYMMAHIDGWERRIDEKQGVWVLPGSGILTTRVSRSLREIVENLFAIQSEFVSERLQRVVVNEGPGGGKTIPELSGTAPRFVEIEQGFRITLPEDLRLALRVKPGDLLGFEMIGETIRVSKLDKSSEEADSGE